MIPRPPKFSPFPYPALLQFHPEPQPQLEQGLVDAEKNGWQALVQAIRQVMAGQREEQNAGTQVTLRLLMPSSAGKKKQKK
mgnify:CR=1 FL=1